MHARLLLGSALLLVGAATAAADTIALPADVIGGHAITVNQTSGAGPSLNGTTTWDGVARLIFDLNTNGIYGDVGDSGCTGALLFGGFSILTAGHCVDDMIALAASAQVSFLDATVQTYLATTALMFPGYTGAVGDPRDLAMLTLSSQVVGVSQYGLYRLMDEAGKSGTLVGYGRGGNGATGSTPGFGTRREANNLVDGYWFDPMYGGLDSLAYDFDAFGFSPARDAFGTCFAAPQTGVAGEGMIAPGDSGGPFFIDGLIAGVHSWGGTFGTACGDVDSLLNSSWGEVAGDTRVSLFADWIDGHTVPEPGTLLLLAAGLAGTARAARSRGRVS